MVASQQEDSHQQIEPVSENWKSRQVERSCAQQSWEVVLLPET